MPAKRCGNTSRGFGWKRHATCCCIRQKKRYEISDEVGYESPEHFSRIFKRYYGESPNHVRG
ncbi:helix-turn-helix domain-containing protein [Cohnella rhizosphaerae]|uniref:helix-turn-helix domain-containing protein n=1 Tax=Cohnella rhizosphaerae TaxID=1457232 RepID=UPI003B8A7ABB